MSGSQGLDWAVTVRKSQSRCTGGGMVSQENFIYKTTGGLVLVLGSNPHGLDGGWVLGSETLRLELRVLRFASFLEASSASLIRWERL